MLIVKTFVCNPFQVNSFLLHNNEGEAILVDPAFQTEEEFQALEKYLSSANLKLQLIINTHGHVDHILGLAAIKRKYEVPFRMHKNDVFLLEDAVTHGMVFGFEVEKPPSPDGFLNDGDTVNLGRDQLRCILVPGHSPGSLVFYDADNNFMIAGDVLFKGSIGRSDLPGGDHDLLIRGIREKLFVLPDETRVFPGHGEPTTLGQEKDENPFF